ncbi:hypothetical protein HK405_009819, partial [Cladochytrium tenue]
MSTAVQAPRSRASALGLLKNAVFYYVLYRAAVRAAREVAIKGPVEAVRDYVRSVLQAVIKSTRAFVPGADQLVQKEVAKTVAGLQADMIGGSRGEHRALPATG